MQHQNLVSQNIDHNYQRLDYHPELENQTILIPNVVKMFTIQNNK